MISISQWHRIDAALCLSCNRTSRFLPVRWTFRSISRLGDGVFWYVLMAALILFDGTAAAPTVIRMLLAGTAGLLVYKWVKRLTLRPRPYEVVPQIEAAAAPLDRFSFPSGHTLHAVSFSLIIAAQYPSWRHWYSVSPPWWPSLDRYWDCTTRATCSPARHSARYSRNVPWPFEPARLPHAWLLSQTTHGAVTPLQQAPPRVPKPQRKRRMTRA